jgi:hypothetical protein
VNTAQEALTKYARDNDAATPVGVMQVIRAMGGDALKLSTNTCDYSSYEEFDF